ncbi:hypothetical protein PCANC_16890 [Puccinia coronata f. sp. avenae]|uniref:Uncharacterized protein n=1 Tax=Puccinia coronata f. sp. avenae TaxID=200324 RepID=A0A2N5SGD6_9BASI|nr:hypothetical protein PCANC_16890 [Puccinia coronata f. sp. avenae]
MALLTRRSRTSRNANSNGDRDTSDNVPIEIEPTGQSDLNTQNNMQANKDVDNILVSVSQSQTESHRAQTPIPTQLSYTVWTRPGPPSKLFGGLGA